MKNGSAAKAFYLNNAAFCSGVVKLSRAQRDDYKSYLFSRLLALESWGSSPLIAEEVSLIRLMIFQLNETLDETTVMLSRSFVATHGRD
jgi:hypothetical protein